MKPAVALQRDPPLAVHAQGRVLPPEQWTRLGELQALVEQVNALHAGASEAIDTARESARLEGLETGMARADEAIRDYIGQLNQRRAQWLAGSEDRIAELACQVVDHLLPELDAARLVPALARQAVSSAQGEQYLVVRVHPDAVDAVQQHLPEYRQMHPAISRIEVLPDESIPPRSCVVVSEAGEVRANLDRQLDAVRRALKAGADQAAP